jgi:nucleoid-associated protein YgaU
MPRYNKTRILKNSNEYYKSLIRSRNVKIIRQYATPILYNPTVADRRKVKTTSHIWKYGDRLYKLAHQFYGDERYWWVIAWYNGYPTEAHIDTGRIIYIPLNIEQALKALRA